MIKTTIAAALISLTALAAAPAQASDVSVRIGFGSPGYGWSDNYRHGDEYRPHHRVHRVSQNEVRWMLRGMGYRYINFYDGREGVYRLSAWKNGALYFLAVSSRSGAILARNLI